jgi:acetyl esterase
MPKQADPRRARWLGAGATHVGRIGAVADEQAGEAQVVIGVNEVIGTSTYNELLAAGRLQADSLHPDTRALLKRAERFGGLTEKVTVDEARRSLQLMTPLLSRRPRVALAETRSIPTAHGSVRVRVVVPSGDRESRPAIVWFHGGGFVLGDLKTAEPTARSLALHTGSIVICVDYRMAPEHSIDDAYQDGLDTVRWVRSNAASLAADPKRIAVGGDSAGGNIAAVVAQEYSATEDHELAAQLLVYPAVSHSHDPFPSKVENLDNGTLDARAIRWFETHIAGSQTPDSDRYAPLRARDVSGLPPAVIVTAGYDPLRDEGLAYYDRLRQADVPATLLHYADDVHGFFTMDGVLANGRAAHADVGRAMTSILKSAPTARPAVRPDSLIALASRPARKRAQRASAWATFAGNRMLRGQTRYQRRLLRLWGLPAGREIEALTAQVNRMDLQLRALRRQLEQAPSHDENS